MFPRCLSGQQIFRTLHPYSILSSCSLALVYGSTVSPQTGPPGQLLRISASVELSAWLSIRSALIPGFAAKVPALVYPSRSDLIIFSLRAQMSSL